jgi:selenide,water dikinase
MKRLNRGAAQAMQQVGIKCATDITGYGLLVHGYEVADASSVTLLFHADALPIAEGALNYARQKQIPGGAGRNKLYVEGKVGYRRELDDEHYEILFDPQTSGGLLMAVPAAERAALEQALESRGVSHWLVGEAVELDPAASNPARVFVD